MDDNEDDARYSQSPYGVSHQHGYGSSHSQKAPVKNTRYPRPVGNRYIDDDAEDDDDDNLDEELGDEEDNSDKNNSSAHLHKDSDDGDEDNVDDDDDGDEDDDMQINIKRVNDIEFARHPKKRRMRSLVSSYEFAPRVPAPPSAGPSVPKPSFGGRNSLTDWTEHETFVLLDAWGDRFLQHGRKSLRSEEWQEVAEKVSEVSKTERTDAQCRNRLDTLKKKYKKEKTKSEETGSGTTSKWVYFKKMDMLMSSPPQQGGLSCGLDSGEYVFMNPRAYLNRANGLDEMRDSPENSESDGDREDDLDGPPTKKRSLGRNNDDGSFRLLAKSIHKISKIYENIENSKRKQMMEIEKMRMDFHRELEMEKRQIMERAQAEIEKLQQDEDEENDASTENHSG